MQAQRTAIYPVNRASHDNRHTVRFCRAAEALLAQTSNVDEIPLGSELQSLIFYKNKFFAHYPKGLIPSVMGLAPFRYLGQFSLYDHYG